MSDRHEWYRELQRLDHEVDSPPTVELRGRFWDVSSSAISRTVGTTSVAIPMGDLTDFEVAECLKSMRIQAVTDYRTPKLTAAEIAADHDFWEARLDAATTREQHDRIEKCRKNLQKGGNPVQALLGFLKPPMEAP